MMKSTQEIAKFVRDRWRDEDNARPSLAAVQAYVSNYVRVMEREGITIIDNGLEEGKCDR